MSYSNQMIVHAVDTMESYLNIKRTMTITRPIPWLHIIAKKKN